MTSNPSSRRQGLLLILGLIFLIFIREPAYLLGPRIWAEEGSIYIQSYLDNGWFDSLFKPQLGYYSLYNNLAVAFSVGVFSLKWSAYGTTILSLLFMLICCTAPAYIPSSYWRSNFQKNSIVIFAITVTSPEIWLNTINVQFFLGLFCCFVLLSEINELTRRRYSFILGVIIIGAFTSATTIVLLPFYLAKAIENRVHKSPKAACRWILISIILITGLIVQAYFYVNTVDISPVKRFGAESIVNLPVGLARTGLYLLKGNSQTVSVIFGMMMGIWGIAAFVRTSHVRYIAILVVYITLILTILSIEMAGGGRYGYIPSVLIIIFFINSYPNRDSKYSNLMLGMVALFLAFKLQFYFDTENYYAESWKPFSVEYENAIGNNHDYVRIFPHREETDWRIIIKKN